MKIITALLLVLVTLALANILAGTEARVSSLYRAKDNTDEVIPHEKVYNSASEPASSAQNPTLHEILNLFASTNNDDKNPGQNNFSQLPNGYRSNIKCSYNLPSLRDMVHPSKFYQYINRLPVHNSKKTRFMIESGLDTLPPLVPMDAGQPPSPKCPPSILSVQPPPREHSSVLSGPPPSPERPPSVLSVGPPPSPKRPPSVLSVQSPPSPRKLTSVLIGTSPPSSRKPPSALSGPPPSPERPSASASQTNSNRI